MIQAVIVFLVRPVIQVGFFFFSETSNTGGWSFEDVTLCHVHNLPAISAGEKLYTIPDSRFIYLTNTGLYPMLFQCWYSVVDAGPTLKQHWMKYCEYWDELHTNLAI